MKTMILILSVLLTVLASCGSQKKSSMIENNKTPDEKGKNENTTIVSAPIVEKAVMWKGEKLDRTELYIERSIQDYFIKFCDSKVTRQEIEKALNAQEGLIKTLKLEVEFKEGEWDNCQENKEEKVASRTGAYVIIHRIVG